MPKYELMYIIGSKTSDDEIPKVISEIQSAVEARGGRVDKHEDLGKKKLAYQIGANRYGDYVLMHFDADSPAIKEIEGTVRTSTAIIRHLIINIDEALVRLAKDQKEQAKLKPPREFTKEKKDEKPGKKFDIDLDAEIEKALEPEELK